MNKVIRPALTGFCFFCISAVFSSCTHSPVTTVGMQKSGREGLVLVTDYKTGRHLAADSDRLECSYDEPDYAFIDAATRNTDQKIAGFGASFTESCGAVLEQMPEAKRREAMRVLFGSGEGQARVSLLRIPMGSSDFGVKPAFTYADEPKGADGLDGFNMDRDKRYVFPYLQEGRKLNPDLQVILAPWTAPAWMKRATKTDRPHIFGGIFNIDYCHSYAKYFVKAIQGYEAAGIPVYGVIIQNEGYHDHLWYPTMEMLPEDAGRFAYECLAPSLKKAGLDRVKIIGASENFVPAVWYTQGVMKTAGGTVTGIGGHCNHGNFGNMRSLRDQYPGLELYSMECSGWTIDTSPVQSFRWHSKIYMLDSLLQGASSVNFWNLCLTPKAEPRLGDCDTCRPALALDPETGSIQANPELYVTGQASHGVRPGAVRLKAELPNDESMVAAAFLNPDGTRSIIAHNMQEEPRLVSFKRADGRFCRYMVPGGGLATVLWKD